jgi:hypothetical protein
MPFNLKDVPWAKQRVKVEGGKVVPVATLNTLARPLGVEVELCRLGDVNRQPLGTVKYEITRDGSVNGDGMELVVAPYAGDAWVNNMTRLWAWLLDCEAEVDHSCGYHVHVAATDLGYFELRRLIRLVLNVEDGLYQCVREGRGEITERGKCYCVPLKGSRKWEGFMRVVQEAKTSTEIKDKMLRCMYPDVRGGKHEGKRTAEQDELIRMNAARIAKVKGHKYEEVRYYGVNLHSFMMRGTVEFRQCEGTLDLDRLIYWPLLCGWLVEAAAQLTDQEVEAVHDLGQLVAGSWARPLGKAFSFPKFVAEWVRKVRRMPPQGELRFA